MPTVAEIVDALKAIESGGANSISIQGDEGQALGPWQEHPAFFSEWYRTVAHEGDTWLEAMQKAATACVQHYTSMGYKPADVAQIFHLGAAAFINQHQFDVNYDQRFQAALKGIMP